MVSTDTPYIRTNQRIPRCRRSQSRLENDLTNLSTSSRFTCEKKPGASAKLAVNRCRPWPVHIKNSQLTAPMCQKAAEMCASSVQCSNFTEDHGGPLSLLIAAQKQNDRPMKNLFEISPGAEKLAEQSILERQRRHFNALGFKLLLMLEKRCRRIKLAWKWP